MTSFYTSFVSFFAKRDGVLLWGIVGAEVFLAGLGDFIGSSTFILDLCSFSVFKLSTGSDFSAFFSYYLSQYRICF
jgi:hypothetical protein